MDRYQEARRLTDKEHGTLNVALTSFADEIEDPSEAQAVRDLAKLLISGEVHIQPPPNATRTS